MFFTRTSWRGLCLCLCLVLTPSVYCYAESAEDSQPILDLQLLSQQLLKVPSGTFVQTKHLHDMPFPLESRGRFTFSDDQGLHWHIESPIQSQLHISRQGISQIENGREVMRMDPGQYPAVAMISQIFFALFGGDWSQLNEHFSLSELQKNNTAPQNAASDWSLTLSPKSELLQQVMPQIHIRGQEQIQQLTLFEASGDKTRIAFYPSEQPTAH